MRLYLKVAKESGVEVKFEVGNILHMDSTALKAKYKVFFFILHSNFVISLNLKRVIPSNPPVTIVLF